MAILSIATFVFLHIMHSNALMHMQYCICMPEKLAVRARMHHGSASLDLTLPAAICKEHHISKGDIFSVEASSRGGDLEIRYKKIL